MRPLAAVHSTHARSDKKSQRARAQKEVPAVCGSCVLWSVGPFSGCPPRASVFRPHRASHVVPLVGRSVGLRALRGY